MTERRVYQSVGTVGALYGNELIRELVDCFPFFLTDDSASTMRLGVGHRGTRKVGTRWCCFWILITAFWRETNQSSVIIVRDDNCDRKFANLFSTLELLVTFEVSVRYRVEVFVIYFLKRCIKVFPYLLLKSVYDISNISSEYT